MEKQKKYKYHFRPEYGSTNLLIEIFDSVDNNSFINHLFEAIKKLNPSVIGVEDLWMNNEILIKIQSDLGDFFFSKDIWDTVFIMASDNQSCLLQIDFLLLNNNNFEKVEVDF